MKILIVEDEFIVANDLRLILQQAGYEVCGIAASVDEARTLINTELPQMALLDIHLQGTLTGIDLGKELKEKNIGFIYVSANSNQKILEAAKSTEPYGFLVKPFRTKDVLVTLEIARYRHENSLESKLRQEQLLQKKLVDTELENKGWAETLLNICKTLQPFIPFDYVSTGFKSTGETAYHVLGFMRIAFDEYQIIGKNELSNITGKSHEDIARLQMQDNTDLDPVIYTREAFTSALQIQTMKKLLAATFNLESHMVLPLFLKNAGIFHFFFYSRRESVFHAEHLALLNRLQYFIIKALEKVLNQQQLLQVIATDKTHNTSVPNANRSKSQFKDIIGNSPLLLAVLDQVNRVAIYDSTVLILGESGTGKEQIAHSIHHLSPRKTKTYIKINCASLPASLIESELFGHEKGAFTGAMEKRIGKFEQANEGTIFLDEIGEMPPDMQVKLLRVLQEKEIERLGGKGSIKINIRIIAATNRNLEKEVAEGRFRMDLYYRLNVFPITLPPLRDRKEDIKLLANHFAIHFYSDFTKPFENISATMMNELETYSWPGNIRELENVIEQAVIFSDGQTELELKRPLNKTVAGDDSAVQIPNGIRSPKTLHDVKEMQLDTERDYIYSILKKTNGRIRGERGAAELLQIKPTTLESKMAKLGIRREDFFDEL